MGYDKDAALHKKVFRLIRKKWDHWRAVLNRKEDSDKLIDDPVAHIK